MAFLFNKKPARKILFVAPEATPFAKAGGLGEVMFSLPRSLHKLGDDVRVMIPRYAGIDPEKFHLKMEYEGLRVPTGSAGDKENEPEYLICNVRKYTPPLNTTDEKLPVTTYFLENQEYYEKRSNIYGYSDDAVRWNLLCRGVLEFLWSSKDWTPDVIISSDWQTGFLPNYLRTFYKTSPRLSSIATIFLIHNLYYQGMFDHRFVSEMDYDDGQSALPSFFDPRIFKINGMRRGIMYSDAVNTVSSTYSREIMTKDYGELLDNLLKERRAHVSGILNGIDYDNFNPKTDSNLKENYDIKTIDSRKANKASLQDRFSLPEEDKTPIIAIVARLTEQKGFDLLVPILEPLLKELGFQLIVVGSGEAKYMGFFKELAEKYPKQVAIHLTFDSILPRLIYGGADMVLLPSKFEPCGLVQLEAMRYGVVPIVRSTGGLADSVSDYNAKTGSGNGFAFDNFDSFSLAIAITRACENYKNQEVWRHIQEHAMKKDMSWDRSAEKYTKLIETAINIREADKDQK
ncbi:MAG: glycogen synthase [Parcubacteria group bacterium]|nr:glycogen synthase [Parcubacteria group bacterium]